MSTALAQQDVQKALQVLLENLLAQNKDLLDVTLGLALHLSRGVNTTLQPDIQKMVTGVFTKQETISCLTTLVLSALEQGAADPREQEALLRVLV